MQMSFIDDALSEISNGEDFVQAMADIYEYPEVRSELYTILDQKYHNSH